MSEDPPTWQDYIEWVQRQHRDRHRRSTLGAGCSQPIAAIEQNTTIGERRATMSIETVTELVKRYREALAQELDTKSHAETLKIHALANAVFDGKNAEARKRQADQALLEAEFYQLAQHDAECAEVDRKVLDAEIGLTKAWLYSQSGH